MSAAAEQRRSEHRYVVETFQEYSVRQHTLGKPIEEAQPMAEDPREEEEEEARPVEEEAALVVAEPAQEQAQPLEEQRLGKRKRNAPRVHDV